MEGRHGSMRLSYSQSLLSSQSCRHLKYSLDNLTGAVESLPDYRFLRFLTAHGLNSLVSHWAALIVGAERLLRRSAMRISQGFWM